MAKRKLLPAIYNLAHEGALPERFNLIGLSRGDIGDDGFREQARESIAQFSRREPDERVLSSLVDRMRYVSASFDDPNGYDALGKIMDEFDEEAGIVFNRLFYLSTAPGFFPVIGEALGEHGLDEREDAVRRLSPILDVLAPPDGWGHMGGHGAGHYVKMVHNGVEYGMMQAYAEGFEIMHASDYDLDMAKIANLWMQGSVVRSWLLELAARAFEQEGTDLAGIRGYVQDSGEGRWTVFDSIDKSVPAPVITLSLMARFSSRQDESYAAKVNAALRNQFGGHAVVQEGATK